MLIYSKATPDMTSPVTYGQHSSKFEKNGRECRLWWALRRILVVRRFVWLNQLVGRMIFTCRRNQARREHM